MKYHLFTRQERRGRNCLGVRGKLPLNQRRLDLVRMLTFRYFPLVRGTEDEDTEWKNCIETINNGLHSEQQVDNKLSKKTCESKR